MHQTRTRPRPPGLHPSWLGGLCLLLGTASLGLGHGGAGNAEPASTGIDDRPVDFAQEILPVLSRTCFACHGPDEESRAGGLRLDQREAALEVRDGPAAILPGDPDGSALIQRIRRSDDRRMPPPEVGHALDSETVELFERWIAEGAEYASHWAFVPPVTPAPPEGGRPDWSRVPFDDHVFANLREHGLTPSAEADRSTLIRRLSLDLIGLPPTPEERRAFVEDERPDAYDHLVDRLLASPHYGERWARVWLDMARYADSAGLGSDPLRTIWRYRDWVIDAYNDNLPFDQFTREQLAGDLLPDATMEQQLATAFHRNTLTNTEGGTDDEEWRIAAVKDRTNTTLQVWMGLTMGCAQCHSHKYDPISQHDYYAFFDFFNQTEDNDQADERPRLETPTPGQLEALAKLDAELEERRAAIAEPGGDELERRQSALAAWIPGAIELARSWRTLPFESLLSEGEAELSFDAASGEVRLVGETPGVDVHRLGFEAKQAGRWTALQLEALVDDAAPGGGPGSRPANGNFVLNELELTVERARATPPRARFLRIELPGDRQILSLAEVEVFGEGRNVAPEGRATQSSVAFGGPPGLAIDGNTSGVFVEGSVTHTAIESDPWWRLDLGREVELERIVLWNRTDGELEQRMAGVEVRLLDSVGAVVWSSLLGQVPDPSEEVGGGSWLERVAFARTDADFEQRGFPIARSIDGRLDPMGGWAVAPEQGRDHAAVFGLRRPLHLAPGDRVEVALHQRYGSAHVLGRYRISATETPDASLLPPPEVLAVLQVDAANWGDADHARLASYFLGIDPGLEALREEIARLERQRAAQTPVTTPVLRELPAERRRETHVLERGNFLQPGEAVTARVLEHIAPWPEGAPRNRLGVAEWLVQDANPLTARVAVNRIWSQLFGIGLVETEEDFGSQGMPPVLPGVLDQLAVEFRDGGWDQKALLRTIVTSATYRQSSEVTEVGLRIDPRNRWLSRGPRFRLEAEQVRDQALALSGLLSKRMHGPSVFPPQPDGLWRAAFNGQRTWTTSEGEDRYRRGLYVFLRRTSPYPSMEAFDAPNREICAVRRLRTNTPLQAFVTLNDPVFVEASQGLARRLIREGGSGDAERIEFAFDLCLGRPVEAEELEALLGLLGAERDHYQDHLEAALTLATDPLGPLPDGLEAPEAAAWTVVANVLLNLDALLVKG